MCKELLRSILISVAITALGLVSQSVRSQEPANLGSLEQVRLFLHDGKIAEALAAAEQYVEHVKESKGTSDPEYGEAIGELARVYAAQGRYAEAETLFLQVVTIFEQPGRSEDDLGRHLLRFAEFYRGLGRYEESEPLYLRALQHTERVLGSDNIEVGITLHNLGLLYWSMGRDREAETALRRSAELAALAPDDPRFVGVMSNLANFLAKRYYASPEAFQILEQALALLTGAFGPDHPKVGEQIRQLGSLYEMRREFRKAEELYTRALTIAENAVGSDRTPVASLLVALAGTYSNTGRSEEAVSAFERALAIYQNASLSGGVSTTLFAMGEHFAKTGEWLRAVEVYSQSATHAAERERLKPSGIRTERARGKSNNERSDGRALKVVTAAHMAAKGRQELEPVLAKQAFESAQSVFGSSVAESITQMGSRGANAKLASLVRERQDLAQEWLKRDEFRSAAFVLTTDRRDPSVEAANLERLGFIESSIAKVDKTLSSEFPEYASLARPTPLSVLQVQSVLSSNEVLLFFLDTGDTGPAPGGETFLWAVSKSEMRWVRFESDIGQTLDKLRCGLDPSRWESNEVTFTSVHDMRFHYPCNLFASYEPKRDSRDAIRNETLPYNLNEAHKLYRTLLGDVESFIRGKHLLIAATGRLSTLSFHALITEAPPERKFRNVKELFEPTPTSFEEYRTAGWLVRKHAITVLPTVAALRTLRQATKRSEARKPLVAVGNPLLKGVAEEAELAELARRKQSCPITVKNTKGAKSPRSAAPIKLHEGRPDLEHLRLQSPLHDTADEICAVASTLKVEQGDIFLGERATETNVKRIDLSQYRILHFATHGTMSGEIDGTTEPGLILTPPAKQNDQDDGYLGASEIAALRLDADWVILSACNTAAAAGSGMEALSGLARSFFYAGARSILASQWAVDSAASVKLITRAVQATQRNPNVGRAEALRRSMVYLIDKGARHEAHPYYWAPFIVVGEGAAL